MSAGMTYNTICFDINENTLFSSIVTYPTPANVLSFREMRIRRKTDWKSSLCDSRKIKEHFKHIAFGKLVRSLILFAVH